MSRHRPWKADEAVEIIGRHREVPGAMLPVLHDLLEAFGYIDGAAVPLIAEALNVSRAEVYGVVSFYHDFRDTPPGRHTLRVCRAEACQSMGCDDLVRHVEDRLGIKLGETTADRSFTLEVVYCLGNCALSPAIMLDGELHGRVSPEAADRLIGQAGSDG